MGGKKPLRRPLWPPTRATASNYYPLGLDGAGGAAKPLLRAPKKPAPLHGRLPAFSGAVDAFERARKCFLEWRYFFSIILSEFLKNRVALQSPQDILYKKIDSMMRGNPVQEIDAALEASGCRKAIVTPSFPQEGRIVREGVLHLPDGSSQDLLQRWHRESRFPVRPIAKEMLQDTATVRDMLFSPQTEVALFDAEDQETLRRIADVCRDIPGILYCGSAGLARELPVPQDDAPKSAPWNGVGKIFVVTGSMKMETAAQIRQLSQKGFQIVPLRVAALNRAEDKAEEISNACRATAAALHGDGPGVVLTFDYLLHAASKGEAAESETTPEQRKAALHLAGSLGAVVRAQDDRLYDAMILVGGDTALSICQALNVHRICLWDEVTPGMPAGIFGDGNAAGLPVVTKSGAFGDCKALSRAVEYIKKE